MWPPFLSVTRAKMEEKITTFEPGKLHEYRALLLRNQELQVPETLQGVGDAKSAIGAHCRSCTLRGTCDPIGSLVFTQASIDELFTTEGGVGVGRSEIVEIGQCYCVRIYCDRFP